MNLLPLIFKGLAALPGILDAIEQIAAMIVAESQKARNEKLDQDAVEAIQKSKSSKDTSKLDQLFDPEKK